jgi:PRTRC genetic system protein C
MATRVFVYDGREFPDPDPNMSVDEVRQSMTSFFPELANADTKQSKRGDDDIVEFQKRVGTKG